ncbi:MAG TPA: tRNA lysidine(34) synthetase TilS, partial [Flavobacterium sp.]
DNIETFLINFVRGTGIDGLTGIPTQNGKIVRPLLDFSRQQLQDFASENQVPWREDSSNSTDKYLRNKIRQEVVPGLKTLNQNFIKSFKDTLSHLQQAQSMAEDASNLVYKQVAIEKEDKVIFKVYDLKLLPNYQAYLYNWLKGFGFTAWKDIYDLMDAQSGKQVFSSKYVLLKDREILVLTTIKTDVDVSFKIPKDTVEIDQPMKVMFTRVAEMNDASIDCIFADEDRLTYPLEIRKWKEGDLFYPFGMKGKKKLSKFFKDEKYSLNDKSNSWILCSGNEIVWVINKRMDERFKVTDKTQNILQIKTLK